MGTNQSSHVIASSSVGRGEGGRDGEGFRRRNDGVLLRGSSVEEEGGGEAFEESQEFHNNVRENIVSFFLNRGCQ